jgi:hypothetical protein
VEFALLGKSTNLLDTASCEAANEYLFVEGRNFEDVWRTQKEAEGVGHVGLTLDVSDFADMQKSGLARVTIEESGPLVASLRIESSAPGCKSLVRKLRLIAGADSIEISNILDKNRAPLNPHPENFQFSREWAQFGGKESVQFAFPFAIPEGKMHIDIPLAEMRPEVDQLPGASKNWLPVGRWIDIANDRLGVTWVTLDAPLVEVGEISATIPGSQHNPLLWREHIAPTQKLYSWVMNNHWGTNYRAYQEGITEFRYALRAHNGYDPAASTRFAIGLSQPLLASVASANPPLSTLLKIESPDVVALALKHADDEKAWIVRLFGASGQRQKVKLNWSTPAPSRVWISDSSEMPLTEVEGEVTVEGWDVLTLRADRP